jgi:quercetin dioxygenase-like cupin family protein
MNLMDDITKIAQLTKDIILIQGKYDHDRVMYDTESGTCTGRAVYNRSEIAIQLAEMSPGTVLKRHSHDVIEILILYAGDMDIQFDDWLKHELILGNPIMIPIGQLHTVSSVGGCKLTGITIPASKVYPPQNKTL